VSRSIELWRDKRTGVNELQNATLGELDGHDIAGLEDKRSDFIPSPDVRRSLRGA
jgi:hypothetical protein